MSSLAISPSPNTHDSSGTAAIPAGSFEQQAALVLGEMQHAFRDFLAFVPGGVRKAADLQRAFDLDSKLAGQMYKVATATSPAVAGANVPPQVSLQRVLKAAARRRFPAPVIDRVGAAFGAFERFVEEYAADRERFESMLSGMSRDEADQIDLKYKKTAHRAMSHLVGADMSTSLYAMMLHPGSAPDKLDVLVARSFVGLHRLRATAPLVLPIGLIRIAGAYSDPVPNFASSTRPLGGAGGNWLMREFSTPGLSDLAVIGADSAAPALEVPAAVGLRESVTITIASSIKDTPSPLSLTGPRAGYRVTPRVRLPAQTLLVDILIHPDAFDRRHPLAAKVSTYRNDRISVGSGEPDYTERTDLLAVREHCEYLGRGFEVLGTPEVPRHVDMLKTAAAAESWNPASFHAYRCRVEYPIVPSSVRVEFDLEQ